MCVTRPVKQSIIEDYITGSFEEDEEFDEETEYYKYKEKIRSVLPYQWGVWVTSYAFYNLFQLGKCAETDMENDNGGIWLYSDTDSCYGVNWNLEKIEEYNNRCIEKLSKRGYVGVPHKGRLYWLGIAETDDDSFYTEFKYQGAKRYCGRLGKDGELHITVAGVPKKTGAKCLKNDINNFSPNFIFRGTETGKVTHYFVFTEKIEIIDGNEVGDSLDLCPCDYVLSSVDCPTWEEITKEVLFNYEFDKVL